MCSLLFLVFVVLGSVYSLPSLEIEELDLLKPHFLHLTQLLSILYSPFHEQGSSLGFWDTILIWFFCLPSSSFSVFFIDSSLSFQPVTLIVQS